MILFGKQTIQKPNDIVIQKEVIETISIDNGGKIVQKDKKNIEYFEDFLSDDIYIKMVLIPNGEFYMGSIHSLGEPDEEPRHSVNIKSFFVSQTTINQKQWIAVTGKVPPCRGKTIDHPVDRISWKDAVKYCENLYKLTRRNYRL